MVILHSIPFFLALAACIGGAIFFAVFRMGAIKCEVGVGDGAYGAVPLPSYLISTPLNASGSRFYSILRTDIPGNTNVKLSAEDTERCKVQHADGSDAEVIIIVTDDIPLAIPAPATVASTIAFPAEPPTSNGFSTYTHEARLHTLCALNGARFTWRPCTSLFVDPTRDVVCGNGVRQAVGVYDQTTKRAGFTFLDEGGRLPSGSRSACNGMFPDFTKKVVSRGPFTHILSALGGSTPEVYPLRRIGCGVGGGPENLMCMTSTTPLPISPHFTLASAPQPSNKAMWTGGARGGPTEITLVPVPDQPNAYVFGELYESGQRVRTIFPMGLSSAALKVADVFDLRYVNLPAGKRLAWRRPARGASDEILGSMALVNAGNGVFVAPATFTTFTGAGKTMGYVVVTTTPYVQMCYGVTWYWDMAVYAAPLEVACIV